MRSLRHGRVYDLKANRTCNKAISADAETLSAQSGVPYDRTESGYPGWIDDLQATIPAAR